jgi:shikimate dehydrogenase
MTDRYAVIGNPIGFSKSPLIHGSFARQFGHDIEYTAMSCEIGGFAARIDRFRAEGARGLNITAPFKRDAFAYATDLSEAARQAGAVNAMKFEGDHVFAENFDGVGLTRDIVANHGVQMRGKRVLLLGAGGAARGALMPFLAEQPAALVLANRTLSKADELGTEFAGAGNLVVCGYADLAAVTEPFDLVINATSASQRGELPPLPSVAFQRAVLAYDLAYGRGLTPFLKAAQDEAVPKLADGVGMLVEQAAEAFAWWRGVRPNTAPLIEELTIKLI